MISIFTPEQTLYPVRRNFIVRVFAICKTQESKIGHHMKFVWIAKGYEWETRPHK